jgi:hypothetical protein
MKSKVADWMVRIKLGCRKDEVDMAQLVPTRQAVYV